MRKMHFFAFYLFVVVLVVNIESVLNLRAVSSKQQTAKCPPLTLRNGYYKGRTDRRRFMRFDCYPGYYLAGQKYLYCKKGQWDGVPPKCVKPTCSAIRNITNGGYFANPSFRGAVIIYFCDPEYKLLGEETTYCDGRIWENPVPTCIKNGESPATECDFEKDLCGWDHDLNHDFDWRRQNKSTPSGHAGTGPQFDHTLGIGHEGNYMYIESTSRLENDTARLFSPLYKPDPNFGCFEFYYHMYGKSIGTLNVYIRRESQNFYLSPVKPNFSKSGNQGDRWYRGNVVVGEFKEPFQIIIEGIRGTNYVSDIAIDDVKLTQSCIEDETTTTINDEESTSLSPFSDPFDAKQSCDGRCFTQTNDSSCTCYEDCLLDNNCCLDFIEICILSSTNNDESTDPNVVKTPASIGTTTISTNSSNVTIKTTLIPSTIQFTNATEATTSTTKTTTSTEKPTTLSTVTTSTVKPNIVVIKTTTSTTKTTTTPVPTTKKPTPTTKTPTPTTKKPTPTTKKPTPTTKKPIPTTLKPTTKSVIGTTILPFKMPTTTKLNTTITKQTTISKSTKEKILIHPLTTEPPLEPSTQSIIASSKMEEKRSYVLPITGIALTVLFIVLLLILSLKKIRKNRTLHSRNQSESATDVRYISSNEIIDFTLASPHDESDRLL